MIKVWKKNMLVTINEVFSNQTIYHHQIYPQLSPTHLNPVKTTRKTQTQKILKM